MAAGPEGVVMASLRSSTFVNSHKGTVRTDCFGMAVGVFVWLVS